MSTVAPRIVIAGSTGALGRTVLETLGADARGFGSKTCSLIRVPDAEVQLAGCDVAVYLARAQRFPAKLSQTSRADLELLMADTFARAAKRVKARRIVAHVESVQSETAAALRSSGLSVDFVTRPRETAAEEIIAHVRGTPVEAGGEGPAPARSAWLPAEGPRCVFSLQRIPLGKNVSALDAARSYFEWSGKHVPLTGLTVAGDKFRLEPLGVPGLALSLIPGTLTDDSATLMAGGGALAAMPAGRCTFEFRKVLGGSALFTSLHGFEPAMPWLLYRISQALMHPRVMRAWGKTLG